LFLNSLYCPEQNHHTMKWLYCISLSHALQVTISGIKCNVVVRGPYARNLNLVERQRLNPKYSHVTKARDSSTDKWYVIKKIRPDEMENGKALDANNFVKIGKSDAVVKFIMQLKCRDEIYVVTELFGKDLEGLKVTSSNSQSLKTASKNFIQVYKHDSKRVCYRDIKPTNLGFDGKTIKFLDVSGLGVRGAKPVPIAVTEMYTDHVTIDLNRGKMFVPCNSRDSSDFSMVLSFANFLNLITTPMLDVRLALAHEGSTDDLHGFDDLLFESMNLCGFRPHVDNIGKWYDNLKNDKCVSKKAFKKLWGEEDDLAHAVQKIIHGNPEFYSEAFEWIKGGRAFYEL